MKKLRIHLKKKINDSYDVILTSNYLKELVIDIKRYNWGKKYAIITDSKVKKLYADKLKKKLKRAGIDSEVISFPHGEKNKNLLQVEKILHQLSKLEIHRDDCIIALGGGVVGDIAGFIASVYLRSIPYIQIPTTLLSMVDSSAGGKTGVDTKWGKNLVGTFYQPKKVYIDTGFFKTLPYKEFKNGIAEIIKYSVIARPGLLKKLKNKKEQIIKHEPSILENIIMACVKIKASIIENDEKENNIRRILNYGHTFGHVLEKISNYKISHGEAVSIGMSMINTIAVQKKWLAKKHHENIKKVIKTYNLPTKYSKALNPKNVINLSKLDKKVLKGKVIFVVPQKLGKVFFTDKITNRDIIKACKKHT